VASCFLREQKVAGRYKAMARSSEGLAALVSQMLQEDPTKGPTAEELLGSAVVQETLRRIRDELRAPPNRPENRRESRQRIRPENSPEKSPENRL
jgi:hypothetical protein